MKLSGSTGCNVTWLIQVYSKDVGKIKRGLWHLEVKKKVSSYKYVIPKNSTLGNTCKELCTNWAGNYHKA